MPGQSSHPILIQFTSLFSEENHTDDGGPQRLNQMSDPIRSDVQVASLLKEVHTTSGTWHKTTLLGNVFLQISKNKGYPKKPAFV